MLQGVYIHGPTKSPDVIEVTHHAYIWRKFLLYFVGCNVWIISDHVATRDIRPNTQPYHCMKSFALCKYTVIANKDNHSAVTWVLDVALVGNWSEELS